MSTKNSPPHKLRAEANKIAKILTDAARGKFVNSQMRREYEAAKAKGTFRAGIVMDDKIITIDIPTADLPNYTRKGLAEYIFNQMAETQNTAH